MYRFLLSIVLCVCALSTASTAARAAEIDVYTNPLDYQNDIELMQLGQPAPPVNAASWLVAEPNAPFQPGQVYVVEFMASWCAPCQKSLPHLSDLSDQYRGAGVQFIGVAAAEQGDDLELRQLVNARADSIRFPIAYVEDAKVYENWMQAGRTMGLPWVFLVDRRGRIAWWGQPFYADFEPALAALVNGADDKLAELQQAVPVPEQASAGWRLARQLAQAEEEGKWTEALSLIDALRGIDLQRYWWEQVQAVRICIEELSDPEQALQRAEALLASALFNNPHALTELSEIMLTGKPTAQRRTLAKRSIEQASKLTSGQNPEVESIRAGL